jgi:hypothetical protein
LLDRLLPAWADYVVATSATGFILGTSLLSYDGMRE